MGFDFDYSEEKNLILKETRKISFEEVIVVIKSKKLLGDLKNPNQKKYPKQKIFIIKANQYVYCVPYIIDEKRKVWFLKTIYPSRKLTKKYAKTKI